MLFFYSKIRFIDIFYFSCSIDSLQNSSHGVGSDTTAGGERGGGGGNSFGLAFSDSLRSDLRVRAFVRLPHGDHGQEQQQQRPRLPPRGLLHLLILVVCGLIVPPLLESVDLLPLDVSEHGARRPRCPRAVTDSLHATAAHPPSPQPPSSTTLSRRPRGHTPCESLSGHQGSCTARQGDSL
jgi:hypothetical protein